MCVCVCVCVTAEYVCVTVVKVYRLNVWIQL